MTQKELNANRLHSACRRRDYQYILGLVGKDEIDLEIPDNFHNTILVNATIWGYNSIVRLLLRYGAKTDTKSYNGYSPLQIAVISGRFPDVIASLLIWNTDPNERLDGLTPLMLACKHRSPRSVEPLVLYGADLDAKTNDGKTAMDISKEGGSISCIEALENASKIVPRLTIRTIKKLLETQKINQKINGSALIHKVCKEGDYDLINFIISQEAEVNIRDNNGDTPLIIVCRGWHVSSIELLLNAGADPNATEANTEFSPLHIVSSLPLTDSIPKLISGGADINKKAKGGLTPLMVSCIHGCSSAALELIDNGADPSLTNDNSETALSLATKHRKTVCVNVINNTSGPTNTSNITTTEPIATTNITTTEPIATTNITTTEPIATTNITTTEPIATTTTEPIATSNTTTVTNDPSAPFRRPRKRNRRRNKRD